MTTETVSIAHEMETKQETSLVLQHYLISDSRQKRRRFPLFLLPSTGAPWSLPVMTSFRQELL